MRAPSHGLKNVIKNAFERNATSPRASLKNLFNKETGFNVLRYASCTTNQAYRECYASSKGNSALRMCFAELS